MKKILTLALFTLAIFSNTSAFAACDPVNDPCAPKKKIGEWDKSLAFGFNMTDGNSETTLLTILGQATKETAEDITDFNLAYFFGTDKKLEATNGGDDTSRDDIRIAGSYKKLLSDRAYAGFGGNYFHDAISKVEYRVLLNPLLGYYLIKNNDFRFGIDAGPSYTFEKVNLVEDNFLSPRIGETFDWTISCTSKIYQSADVYFKTGDQSGEYLINAQLGVESALSSQLSLVVGLREIYNSNPGAGFEKGDLAMITALKVAL